MKFNFKKITSVLASAVMLGSTIGIAAAANYPAPFISGGVADVSVVVGAASPNNVDYIAATDLGSSLSTELAAQSATGTSGSTASGGDYYKLTRTTDKLNLNDALTDVLTTAKMTKEDLPVLLADGTFRSKDNIDYAYEQTLQLFDGTNFTHFDDDDYKVDTPSLGIHIDKNQYILNYSLEFNKYPRSDVDANGRLEDIEDRDVTLLGNTYKLLNAYNKSSDTKLELMKGATTDTINLNEEKTEKVGDKSYTITLTFVDATYVQFSVVDGGGTSQTTTKLAKGGTYKLADGSQLGVTDISYQAFSGGVMSAEFTLGANKLTIENGQVLEIDDIDENSLKCYITRTEVDANKVDIEKITLEWKTNKELFVADGSTATFPGLESLKLNYGGFVKPCEETVKIKGRGSYGIEISVPIKDGETPSFGILDGDSSTGATNFTYIAADSDGKHQLRTGNSTAGNWIEYNSNYDDYFVASWNDTTSAESYLLTITSVTEDTTVGKNYTTIRNVVTGTDYTKKTTSNVVKMGSVELTIQSINYDNEIVILSINTGGTFNRIYTAGGLGIWLPVNCTGPAESCGTWQGNGVVQNWGVIFNDTEVTSTDFQLFMTEEDKDGNIGSGGIINITLGHSSNEAEVTEILASHASYDWSAGAYKEIGDTNEYEGYVASDLGSRVLFKKPTSGQNTAEVTYLCSQSYADVYITAPETVISGTDGATELGTVTYYDNELTATAKAKNLIVVGGSCINTVAAELLGGSLCTAEFTTKTGVGADQFLVQVFNNPYTTGKVAMLVAGYEAADTKKAVTYVTKESPATTVGTALKKVTATYADVA